MKLSTANSVRASYIHAICEALDEDIGMIASNTINFPIAVDGEEGWVEITVKVPKEDGDDGYMKRQQYADKVVAAAERKAKAEAKRQKREDK